MGVERSREISKLDRAVRVAAGFLERTPDELTRHDRDISLDVMRLEVTYGIHLALHPRTGLLAEAMNRDSTVIEDRIKRAEELTNSNLMAKKIVTGIRRRLRPHRRTHDTVAG